MKLPLMNYKRKRKTEFKINLSKIMVESNTEISHQLSTEREAACTFRRKKCFFKEKARIGI